MTQTTRALLAVSALALGAVALPHGAAFAQAAKPAAKETAKPAEKPAEAPKPIALTQQQIDGLVAAQPALAKIPGATSETPDAKTQAAVDAIAKSNGFADSDEMEAAGDSVEAVLAGTDPESKTYVGITPLIKKQIAQVEADKKIPAKDKAEILKELKGALAGGEPPKPSEGNIALVAKNYDKLSQIQTGEK